jgi:DNA-binding response OmpR family regulator
MARIIMAEDDEIVGEVASDALIAAGHAVGVLKDGAEALKVIQARRPDLVILDCNIPGMSGLLVLRTMRDSQDLHDTPVLMLTGRQSDRDTDIAYYEGADDYMKKPFLPDELVFRVDELLKRKKAGPAGR